MNGGGFQIIISMLNRRLTIDDLEPEDTIEFLKTKIYDKEGIPIEQQRLLLNSKHLEDHRSLEDCKIQKDTTLRLVLKLTN